MTKRIVVYVDPPWAVGADGCTDPSLARIERDIFGGDFELRFGSARAGRYEVSGPAFQDLVAGAHALVINRCVITNELLDSVGGALRVVGRQGVGYDNLAPELLEARGIMGFNIPDYCVDEVAAHTLALLLGLERGLLPQHVGLSTGKFDIYAGGMPRRLRSQTAGIVGLGRVGRAVAMRLRAFYGEVIAYDPYVSADLMAAHDVVKVDRDTLLASADVVTLHCLLSEETSRMFDGKAFEAAKRGAVFVNAARGGLVDARALYHALTEGPLAAAGLDVFDPEDPHQDEWGRRLVKLPNVLVSSHRAFLSGESYISQRARVAEGVFQVLTTGKPPAAGLITPGAQRNPLPRPKAIAC